MNLKVLLFAGGVLACGLSSVEAAPVLTATNFTYDLKSSGTSSALSATGTGFNFTINDAALVGNLVLNYGATLITPILPDSAANPPVAQITIGATTYTVLLTRTSATITPSPSVTLVSGEPSTFSVAAVAQFQYTACVEFNHLPLCDPNFASPIADISVNLPGQLTVSLTPNGGQQQSYTILSELFVSTPEPSTLALWTIGLSLGLWARKSRARS